MQQVSNKHNYYISFSNFTFIKSTLKQFLTLTSLNIHRFIEISQIDCFFLYFINNMRKIVNCIKIIKKFTFCFSIKRDF